MPKAQQKAARDTETAILQSSVTLVGLRNVPLRQVPTPRFGAKEGFLYVIPLDLQKDRRIQGKQAGSADYSQNKEWKFALECDRETSAGTFRDQYLVHRQLVDRDPGEQLEKLSLSSKEKAYYRREFAQLRHLNYIARSYSGWLLTNKGFQDEQDDFLNKWASPIKEYGFPGPLFSPRPSRRFPAADADGHKLEDYVRDFDVFCIRWRLNTLVGPDLPEPLRPLIGGSVPTSIFEQLASKGGVFFYPDTFPIESRDSLAKLLESGLGREQVAEANPHLQEWHRIVSRGNTAKSQMSKFEKIRRFVHYWRLVKTRLASNSTAKQNLRLIGAVADFLKLEMPTVKNYQRFLSERLGKEWDSRVAPLTASEF